MKKVFTTTLILSLIIPQITFASWWNPLTWFKSSNLVSKNQNVELVNQKKDTYVAKNSPIPATSIRLAATTSDFYKYPYTRFLKQVDPTTFRTLNNFSGVPFAKDAQHVFYGSTLFQGADPNSFEIIFDQDGINFERDKNHVYLKDKIIPNLSPKDVSIIGEGPSADSCQWSVFIKSDGVIYVMHDYTGMKGYEKNPFILYKIENADLDSFKYSGLGYATDKNHVYFNEKIVEGANPKTFKLPENLCTF
jgi:hypothetical protein